MILSHMSSMTPPREFIRSANVCTRSTTQCHIKHVATKHRNTLQHTATPCNALQRTATHTSDTLPLSQRASACTRSTMQGHITHVAKTQCNTLQHTQMTLYHSQRAQARALKARHSLLGAFSLVRFLFLHTASCKRRRNRHRRSHVRQYLDLSQNSSW